MTGGSLGLRTGSYGSLPQQQTTNGVVRAQNFIVVRKPAKLSLSGSREKERLMPYILRHLVRRNVIMVILLITAFAFCMTGFFKVNRGLFYSCFLFWFSMFSCLQFVMWRASSLLFLDDKVNCPTVVEYTDFKSRHFFLFFYWGSMLKLKHTRCLS